MSDPVEEAIVPAYEARTIEAEDDGVLLQSHVVDDLVVSPLEESRVDREDRFQSLEAETGGECRPVLLGDADVIVAVRKAPLETRETGAVRHGCGDRVDSGIVLAETDHRFPESVAVRPSSRRSDRLDRRWLLRMA